MATQMILRGATFGDWVKSLRQQQEAGGGAAFYFIGWRGRRWSIEEFRPANQRKARQLGVVLYLAPADHADRRGCDDFGRPLLTVDEVLEGAERFPQYAERILLLNFPVPSSRRLVVIEGGLDRYEEASCEGVILPVGAGA